MNNKNLNPETDESVPLLNIVDRLEAVNRSTKESSLFYEQPESHSLPLIKLISDVFVNQQYQEAILDHLPLGIMMVDSDGKVTTYNKAAEKILEIPGHEVLFQSFWINFPDKILGFSLRQSLKEMKSPGQMVAKRTDKNGYDTEIEVEASTVNFSSLGKTGLQTARFYFKGMMMLFRDVTERKHDERIFQRKQHMDQLREMAGMVAHEIRNPLGGIKGFASLLERDLTDKPDLKKMASYIIEGANHLDDLVSRILRYARPLNTRYEPVNLITLIQQIRDELLNEEVFCRHYPFEILCQSSSLIATIDLESMRQSITHLIKNAIQSISGEKGKITIILEQDAKNISIKIKDTGAGIPLENLNKVFSPFFMMRSENNFDLSEVHKVIQLHGGNIDVESEIGQGSTFTLRLPLRRESNKE
jgi:PAS domain S-box-containing protein